MSSDRAVARVSARGFAVTVVLLWAILPGAGQSPSLRIASAGPSGELGELADADEVRIVFSEPMIALGATPAGTAPPWIRMTPAVAGSFYWSGTKTLIFSPDTSAPLPFATKFTVHVDATATSISGRALGAPYDLVFTTPTVRLLGAEWYRQTGRFDSPAVLVLRFNQRVRPEDVVTHVHIALTPHAWTAPVLSTKARDRLRQTDPIGLNHFDEKVAAVKRITSSSEAVGVRIAPSWDERRFPPEPDRVVLETTVAPPPDSRLTVTMDARLPSPVGPETHAAQSTVVGLEPTFFVTGVSCEAACSPSRYNHLNFTQTVAFSGVARALTIDDVTDPAGERPVVPARSVAPGIASLLTTTSRVQDVGFDAQPPVRTWRLALDPGLQAGDGQTLGYPWLGFIENMHEQPFVAFGGEVWKAGGGPQLPLNARNTASVTQWMARVAPSSVMQRLLERSEQQDPPLPPVQSETRRLNMTPDIVQAHGLDVHRLLSSGGTGIVWAAVEPAELLPRAMPPPGRTTWEETLSAHALQRARSTLAQVTNLGISVKDSPRSMLVFVTRLDSGAPVPDARVAIVDKSNQTRWRGTTDHDGVALAPVPALRQPNRLWDLSFVVTAEKDGDCAFVGSNWNDGVHPGFWSVGFWPGESGTVPRGSAFTDRGVYRETDTVHVKAIVRDDTPAGMRLLPAGGTLDVVVRDSREREVDRRTVTVNRWSSAEWTWRVPAGAALGNYHIAMSRAGVAVSQDPEENGSFLVAAYRRPDFRVDATLASDPAVQGSTLHGAVQAKYLFGGALGTRPLRWWFTRELIQSAPQAVRERYPEARYALGYLPRPDRWPPKAALPEKTATLDDDGRKKIDLLTSAEDDAAYSYTLEADVEDVSGLHIANRAALVVHPASLYVAMSRPLRFVDTKTGTKVGLVAVDLAGRSIADVPVTVSLFREHWTSVRHPEHGNYLEWERHEIPSGEWVIRTAAGETPLPIPVRDGGCYILRAIAHDADGRQTGTELSFYALGAGVSSWRSEGHHIDLTPERETWKPGETARILIQSPWQRATALITMEREGIRSHRRMTITSTQDTVELPITKDDVPNVYVSVLLVKGRTSTELAGDGADAGQPSYRVGYTELSVDDSAKRLRVDVSADREEYRPRQEMKVSVAVAAPDGKPSSAEVTLWAMDYGLLSLTNYATPDVLKSIYMPKALQVMTEDNRQRLMSRRAMAGPPEGQPGGGGGGGGNVLQTSMAIRGGSIEDAYVDGPRHDFRPLVFWLGSATTDAGGRAATTVVLPDSLTTYRIMAVAGDQASRFGSGEREIRVTKPLTLLPAFPRFLNTGDRASFGAVVTNSGKEASNGIVTIQTLDPDILQFGGVATRTFHLAAGASEPVKFDAFAHGRGGARVRMAVTLGTDSDAFEMPLVINMPTRPKTSAAYGDTVGTATEKLGLPSGLLPGAGGLIVELASTALVGLGEGARYLDEYPYDCAEQKASRALALLLASDVGGAFTLSGIKPEEYRAAGTSAVNALYGYQCARGGFALWAGRCESESAYLTSYVLHVMKVAETLGVPLDRDAVDGALDYLQRELSQPPPEIRWWPVWGASQAYSVKVLAEFGRNPSVHITRLAGFAERLPAFALSYLADALAAAHDHGPLYLDILRRLTNALRIEADRAHVEEIDDAALGWLWNTDVRATAVVLDGLSRRKDDATLVAPLVRWLVAARTNGRWATTHENATALEALVAYYRAFESEVPQMTTAVRVGVATVGTATFNGRSTAAQQVQMSMPDLLEQVAAATSPTLSIARTGTGRVYYTARVQYFAPEPADAIDRGFRVERRYERYVKDGASPATTTFNTGDVIRVTAVVTLRGEGRYLALTDPLPAGFEPLEGWFRTTASDLAREATRTSTGDDWLSWWRRGDFDHVEKHDDRVVAFATRLGSGRHEFSYLVRATTAGTFGAAGARVEAMYAPELEGRSQAATVTVR
jgi:uncharacterized protein YfaS (alpha-2-macroglobulin family)